MIKIIDYILYGACVFLALGSLVLSCRTRFIQLRVFSHLVAFVRASLQDRKKRHAHTISPHRALLTAMSTTLGITTIVGPIIAMRLGGGPGALLGFLFMALLGSSATYLEVSLTMQHRAYRECGNVMGGPMYYLHKMASPGVAKWYAACCLVLMTFWSGAQANQLAAVLDSPFMGQWRIPSFVSGLCLVGLIMTALFGGIKRIGAISSKLVPLLFGLYLGSGIWILCSHHEQLLSILKLIWSSAWEPHTLAGGVCVGGLFNALRWGIFKGVQATEAGVGTQAIPHAMAETKDPHAQAVLAMCSTYTAGFVSFFSGCIALATGAWQNDALPLGISMALSSFQMHFSYFGTFVVAISALLFGFGTILGNSYNGTRCFEYLFARSRKRYYLAVVGVMILWGSMAQVTIVWSSIDIVLACMAIPHMAALVWYALKTPYAQLVVQEPSRVSASS